MKKKEMKKLDEIEAQKKLRDEDKSILKNKVFDNLLIATNIVLLVFIFLLARKFLSREHAELLYKTSSIIFGILTITLFEISFRKQNKVLAIHGIEMFFLSIAILFMPYMFYEKTENWKLLIGVYAFIYYIIKIIAIYYKQKNLHLKEISDIQEIVKKESKDNINKERIEKLEIKKLKEEKAKTENKTKKKRGRPKKSDNGNNQEESTNKPKRGRPKKSEITKKQESKNSNEEKPKRGRPKKTEVVEKEEPTVKRKRGRPKKEETL